MIYGNISSDKEVLGFGTDPPLGPTFSYSAIWVLDPKMCFAVIMNWSQAEIQIRHLNKGISVGE